MMPVSDDESGATTNKFHGHQNTCLQLISAKCSIWSDQEKWISDQHNFCSTSRDL